MRFLPLFTLGICASAALAQPNETPTTAKPAAQAMPLPAVPRPGEPKTQIEFDMKALLNSLNAQSAENDSLTFDIPAFISGGRIGYFGLSEWKDYFLQQRQPIRYRFDKIDFEALEKDSARIKIFYSLLTPDDIAPADEKLAEPAVSVEKQSETLDLKREIVSWLVGNTQESSEKWRIVPPNREDVQQTRLLSLRKTAYYASQRAGILPQLRAQISMSRLKQISLGAIQFVQDYDEIFKFQNEFWPEAIKPYVRSESLFLIPGSKTPYTFNDNLSDKNLAAINEAVQTVLFYEGSDEKPVFRYEGKAAICFADGHVELVTPDAAQKLIWKP